MKFIHRKTTVNFLNFIIFTVVFVVYNNRIAIALNYGLDNLKYGSLVLYFVLLYT